MAALWNRAGHYIFALWFLSSFFLSFFRRLISAHLQLRNYATHNCQTANLYVTLVTESDIDVLVQCHSIYDAGTCTHLVKG